mgnify:CR=1 FL=1
MSDLLEHAKRELSIVFREPEDEMTKKYYEMMTHDVLEIVEAFAKQGHSGASASNAIAILSALLQYQPLAPLTGEDSEWQEVKTGRVTPPLYQNIRCSRVFKQGGRAWDVSAILFRDPDGACFTNGNSTADVEFPYSPKTTIVDREAVQN